MPPNFQWIQFSTAIAQLSQRLNDPGNVFWSSAECGIYIKQALRMFNALTYTWNVDFNYFSSSLWNSLATLSGSPRFRTITDVDCYTQMEYMLLEPPTGGTWTGTSQFNISNLSQALQARRDEMLQVGNLNQAHVTGIPVVPNVRRTYVADTTIDVARLRYVPVSGGPTVLFRDDMVAAEFYQAPIYQTPSGTPTAYSLTSEAPLAFDVDIPPNQPGTYEAVMLQSGAAFNPPTPTLLNIPDDFGWVLIWGALSDLLGRESEATDRARADYCLKRYMDGLAMLAKSPWLMMGRVNGRACSCDSFFDTDRYMPGWENTPDAFGPVIVLGGTDFIAAPTNSGIGLTVLGSAPMPTSGSDYVQVSRSNYDTVLDLAQAFACFKMGGGEWQQALELEQRGVQACAAENSRLSSLGAFSDILDQRGSAQDRSQNRYNAASATKTQGNS